MSCSKNYGYIYDIDSKKPIKGVVVQDVNNPDNKIITDIEGRFSFYKCNDLIIRKKEYEVDTLQKYGCKPSGKCFDGHIFYMQKK